MYCLMILLLKSYPYHFVRTILSIPFCPIPFCPYTILSIPFCPLPFCPRTVVSFMLRLKWSHTRHCCYCNNILIVKYHCQINSLVSVLPCCWLWMLEFASTLPNSIAVLIFSWHLFMCLAWFLFIFPFVVEFKK